MRYREIKKGMKVEVYRLCSSITGKCCILKDKHTGKVVQINSSAYPFPIVIRTKDSPGVGIYSHKELKEIK